MEQFYYDKSCAMICLYFSIDGIPFGRKFFKIAKPALMLFSVKVV